ncbi:MAG: SDR family oxidoreductase [Actinomycetia bacterium]|nr:SDR family oxidoreductase [Actinomycetes bacterium]
MATGRFVGKVAWITGGARGIGLATAERLVAEGGRVALTDLDGERAQTEAARLGPAAMALRLDVRDPAQHREVVEQILARFGQIDILVTSAGITGRSVPTWELTPAEWLDVIAVDLSGAFFACQAVLPHMRARRYGRIVNLASIAGKEGNPNAVAYSAAKAGVIGMTKAIAKEVATEGILVNAVAPAVIRTEILAQMSEAHVQYMLARIPMQRMGTLEEVAALVAWLASDECSFSTGAVYDISGGRATY